MSQTINPKAACFHAETQNLDTIDVKLPIRLIDRIEQHAVISQDSIENVIIYALDFFMLANRINSDQSTKESCVGN